jgi:hypothetical protein
MKQLFGGIIVLILLGLYVYAVVHAIQLAMQPGPGPFELETGFVTVLHMIGGFISALVIAELAITQPGAAPGARMFAAAGSATPAPGLNFPTIFAAAYIAVWILLGLAAFVIGFLNRPGVVQPLTDLGQAWFGLAVAAGYAYFGISPAGGGNN